MKKKLSKRFKKLIEISKNKQIETIEEAIKKIKKNCTSKFNESIDVSFTLNLKNKKEEANLRTIVNLPNGNGKKIKIAVLCEESKILGPKGLMPNPKLGTVTDDIQSAVKAIKTGQIEIKNDKDGNLSASIGKKSFSDTKIKENYDNFKQTILKEKPIGIKGDFIISAFLTSTMGISYKLKLRD